MNSFEITEHRKKISRTPERGIPLILWSGGYDSTMLLVEACRYGPVDVLYVSSEQHRDKIVKELEARQKILKILREEYAATINELEVTFNLHGTGSGINQSGLIHAHHVVLSQPVLWLTPAAFAVNPNRHAFLAVSYIAGDSTIPMLDSIRDLWKALMNCTRIAGEWQQYPPLIFPYTGLDKEQIVKTLPRDILQHIWTCETPYAPSNPSDGVFMGKKFWYHQAGQAVHSPGLTHKSRNGMDFDPQYYTLYRPATTIKACGFCRPCQAIKKVIPDIDSVQQDRDDAGSLCKG